MAKNRVMPQHLTGFEMSFDEIADELGIQPGTARLIFRDGMAKLRNRFPSQLRQLLSESKAMRR